MRYIVHVLDNSSQHEKKEKNYNIVLGRDVKDESCHVLQSDSFYRIEVESSFDAVSCITKIIRVEDSDGDKKLLSEFLIKTQKSQLNTDFDEEVVEIDDKKLIYSHNAYGETFELICQIEKGEENKWIEFHRIQFFVVEEKKIIEIL